MERELTIHDFEELWYFAREVLYQIRYQYVLLNEDGDFIGYDKARKEDYLVDELNNPITKYLFWDMIEEFRTMKIADAVDLDTEEIRSRYLSEILPLARACMRKDSLLICRPVSEDISDEYLDELLCMAWKSELMIRVVHYNKLNWAEERKKEE